MRCFLAYKGFESDRIHRGFQYEIGKTYTMKDEPKLCEMEDNIMSFNPTTIKGKFVWGEMRPEDFYNEVWKFMKEADEMNADEFCECVGCGREVFDIFFNIEEAKKRLNEYKAKNEIKPGDYVKVKDKDSAYANYDILVVDVVDFWRNGDYTYKCIGKKHGVDPALISENSYIFIYLFHSQVEKTGKRCKHFNHTMYSLFEDC